MRLESFQDVSDGQHEEMAGTRSLLQFVGDA